VYKKIYQLLFISIVFIMFSCGGSGEVVDGKIPFANKNVIIFHNVSEFTINDFHNYFDRNYINKNYYPTYNMNCEEIGFKYVDIKYLEDYTYSRRYIDNDGIYNCFEITSDGDVHKGAINSIMTTDYL